MSLYLCEYYIFYLSVYKKKKIFYYVIAHKEEIKDFNDGVLKEIDNLSETGTTLTGKN